MMIKKRFTEDRYAQEPWFRALCAAFLSCRTEEEVGQFLRDVGTLSELQAWSERFEVAKQLVRGLSYRQVAKNTGASTTTVTRVAKFLENGTGAYRRILHAHRHHRLKSTKRAHSWAQQISNQSADTSLRVKEMGEEGHHAPTPLTRCEVSLPASSPSGTSEMLPERILSPLQKYLRKANIPEGK